ncbi:hypothetical protein [Psychrobacter sp. I-STPA10]|uniref:hypothetical protein n=1 Tax=Psychrobacter sp. I-STPA10 TaxID=2585769 RepID=UPI001E569501|nr:hypothetical protein [Psychrobacter sp. I-STPA10]
MSMVKHIETDLPVLTAEQVTRLQKLEKMSDSDIHCDDIPEVTDWTKAIRGAIVNQSSGLDTDVAQWLSKQDETTKSRINTMLRQVMALHSVS